MFKPLFALLLMSSAASFAATEDAAPAPDQTSAASAPKKHRFHAPKLRHGAKPAENPEASPFKKGGN